MSSDIAGQVAFRKMLRRNLVLPLVFSVLTAGLLIGIVFYLLDSSRRVDHSDQIVSVARYYEKLVIDSETGVRGYLTYGTESFLQPFNEASAKLPQVHEKIRLLVASNPAKMNSIDSIYRSYQSWVSVAQVSIQAKHDRKDFGDGRTSKVAMDDIRRQFDNFIDNEENERIERSHHTDQVAGLSVFLVIILSVLLGAIFVLMSRRQLRLLAGEYETALRVQEEKNALLRDSDWVKTGINELSQHVVGEKSSEELIRVTLDFIVGRVGAAIGAFYRNRDGRALELAAGHGVPLEQTLLPRSIPFGETLLGQVARDRKPVFLGQPPGDYPVRVETGLTSVAPKGVALVPVVSETGMKGLLELGFLHEVSAPARDFLTQSAALLGTALNSAEYRQQLVNLLEESQRQAEELNIQGEELKQTNENLEQQSQEMQAQQALLEQTNNELEAQQVALQEKKDQLENNNRQLEAMHSNLREQADRLALANKYKSEFLANMSHELRTPLNSIIILAKLLEDQPADVKGTSESAATIHSSALDLLSLINDILDLSKIEAGRLEIHPTRMGVVAFTEKLRRQFGPLATNKGIQFEVEVAEGVPDEILCDEMRLEQILRNFISNGIKFTERGQVSVAVSPAGGDGEDVRAIEIAVRDTGIGIPPDKQELIFEAFEQLDGSDARRYGGTGLGLTIARRLSQLLGAQISVSSRVGAGSTFTLLVPVTPPVAGPAPLDIAAAAPVVREAAPVMEVAKDKPRAPLIDDRGHLHRRDHVVQIIEDDAFFARHLLETARARGFKCVVSPDGASGWRDAQSLLPDAILLDLRLPEIDGLSLLEKLKSNAKTAVIPVHAISSASEERHSALEKGAVEFLAKPASRDAVGEMLERIEQARRARGGALNRVLIVEDSAPDRNALTRLLVAHGLDVLGTDRVGAAKDLYSAHDIDLVLVDLALADGSGFEFLDFLRQQGGRRCGVIVYTARDLTSEEKERLSDRSDTIVVKGAKSMERVLQEVTLFLRGVEREMPAGTRPTVNPGGSVQHRDESLTGKIALVVDDDMRNVFALRRVLDSRGMKTVVARTGREALQRLDESIHVDIVLMDIMMPEMDGLEAIRRIRGDARWRKVPILALTAKAMAGDREKCLQAGADDYLAKPVDFDRLLGLVKVWIHKV